MIPLIGEAIAAGATIVTANQRLARDLRARHSDARRAAGEQSWLSPSILPWPALVESLARAATTPVLTPVQELSIWESVVEASPGAEDLLHTRAAARLARQAWLLIHQWKVPISGKARGHWESSTEAAAFLEWTRQYEWHCRWLDRADAARLPALIDPGAAPAHIVLAGFDELTPQQRDLLATLEDAGTRIVHAPPHPEPAPPLFARLAPMSSPDNELAAAAAWAGVRYKTNPNARIGVIVPDLEARRAAVARMFHMELPGAFHISLGPSLAERPVVAAALRLLELCGDRVAWETASSLIRSPYLAGAAAERSARAQLEVALRRWRAVELAPSAIARHSACPPELGRRFRSCETICRDVPASQRASEWAALFSRVLEAFGWPDKPSSEDYQAAEAWRAALSDLASLDVTQGPLELPRALAAIRRIAADRRFEVESRGEPVQVMGVLEASGSQFDALWICGLDEDAWPARSDPNPFLPLSLQRKLGMPHSSPARELEWARRLTSRLLASSAETVVSYGAAVEDRALGPSPLVAALPRLEPAGGPIVPHRPAAFEQFEDAAGPPLVVDGVQAGGSRALQLQALCPFRAFAELRLGARAIEDPELGLDPRDRGTFLHAALEALWTRLGSSEALRAATGEQLSEAAREAAAQAFGQRPPGRDPFEEKLFAMERERLEVLLSTWLTVERERGTGFTVTPPEQSREAAIGGLQMRIRLDRMDRLASGGHAIIDYKTTAPKLSDLEGGRPEDPQLALYAVTTAERLDAIAFAQVKTGQCKFRGYATEAAALPGLKPVSEAELRQRVGDWREALERLAAHFRAGDAAVDPKDGPKTCQYCHLAALCRVSERRSNA